MTDSEALENLPLLTLLSVLPSGLRRSIQAQSLSRDELEQADTLFSQALLQIRAQLNLLSPIDKLPPEILAQCFEHARSIYWNNRGNDLKVEYRTGHKHPLEVRTLITITHVCKRWRAVALGTPTLWTDIDDDRPAHVEASLTRSGNAPISVHLRTKDLSRTALALSTHGHRMKRLDLTVHPRAHFIPPLLQFEAPLLKCLTICSGAGSPPPAEQFTTILFRTHVLDNLQALALVGINMWLPGNHFPHLTYLHLSHISGRILVDDTMRHLRRLFLNTPALEYLFVSGLGRGAAVTSVTDTVRLPALRRLTCTQSTFLSAFRLFALLELPEDTMVRLDTMECLSATSSILPFQIPSRELLSSLDTLELVSEGEDLHLIAEGPMSGLWIQAESVEDSWELWLAQLETMLPMPSIERLQVSVTDPEIIPRLLRQFPRLDQLSVYLDEEAFETPDESQAVLRSLYSVLEETNPVVCPQLQEFNLQVYMVPPERLAPAVFIETVKTRQAHGCPLHTVALDVDYGIGGEEGFEDAFRPVEEYLTSLLDIHSRYGLCGFSMNMVWEDLEEERWWRVPEEERASETYDIPFEDPLETYDSDYEPF
ncbi:hypothetical protein GY45DRAFT_1325420 [Cubamyces sp. BRFM 1775]|nr:hypothetical protein GY45DRAFT_1325420 [Cubamyces sp. BRFM 1775]